MKLICLNIEGDRHLENRILPFLRREGAEVICLQEVYKDNLDILGDGYQTTFAPLMKLSGRHWGLAILSRSNVVRSEILVYAGSTTNLVEMEDLKSNHARALLTAEIFYQSKRYVVINTHFTWTPDGQTSEEQLRHFTIMDKFLEEYPQAIVTGDFNSPRRTGEIYTRLARRYRDNIPERATTTLDPNLHKAGRMEYVVDGVFTSPEYQVTSIRLQDGVSDHQAIVANIV